MSEKINVAEGHRLLLVSLNKTYENIKGKGHYARPNLYECARKYWIIKKTRADKADYVLGVYKGIVKVVIKPTTEWTPTNFRDDGSPLHRTRYVVEGITDDEQGNRLYLGKDVTDYPFGSGGAIRYVTSENTVWK